MLLANALVLSRFMAVDEGPKATVVCPQITQSLKSYAQQGFSLKEAPNFLLLILSLFKSKQRENPCGT